jgi:hypothetical protein
MEPEGLQKSTIPAVNKACKYKRYDNRPREHFKSTNELMNG